ncbi:MAG: metallophosphoesterase [Spirochaetales bacterium]|nr:metallophosphoesterase [Spirochaetales bacterium]
MQAGRSSHYHAPMTIAQISDLHLGRSPYPGVDAQANLQKVLEDVSGQGVDLIVVSGDLVQDENDEGAYVAARERLDACGPPYRVMPGNHDDCVLLSRIFELAPHSTGEVYSHEPRDGADLIFLDSSRAVFSPAQWDWLVKRVRASHAPYVFIHHPPVPAGVPLMDRDWPFLEDAEFRSRLLSMKMTISVFCGHYHTEKTVQGENLDMFLCPAVNLQFDGTGDELQIGSLRPGWRKIDIDGERLATSVRYVER